MEVCGALVGLLVEGDIVGLEVNGEVDGFEVRGDDVGFLVEGLTVHQEIRLCNPLLHAQVYLHRLHSR